MTLEQISKLTNLSPVLVAWIHQHYDARRLNIRAFIGTVAELEKQRISNQSLTNKNILFWGNVHNRTYYNADSKLVQQRYNDSIARNTDVLFSRISHTDNQDNDPLHVLILEFN